jgi:hypothetical protein
MLCEKLINRNITFDIFKKKSFEFGWEVIIRTMSSLIAQKFVKCENNIEIYKEYPIVRDSITDFL